MIEKAGHGGGKAERSWRKYQQLDQVWLAE